MAIEHRGNRLARDIPNQQNARDSALPGVGLRPDARTLLPAHILESSAAAVFALDFDGVVLFWNPAAASLYGWAAEEVVGRSTFDLMPGAPETERTRQTLAEMRDRESWTQEIDIVRKDGSTFSGEVTLSRLQDDRGNMIGVVGVTSDITNRRRAEQRLTILYTVTRLLSEAQDVPSVAEDILMAICQEIRWDWGALWLTDDESNTLYCVAIWDGNEGLFSDFSSVAEVFRYPLGGGLPGGAWQSGNPDWIADITNEHRMIRRDAALKSGISSAMEVPVRFGLRQVRGVIELMSRAKVEPDDQVLEMVSAAARQLGLFLERQRVADSLQQHESRMRQLEESELIGIIRAYLDGAIVEANDAFLAMTGYSRDDLATGLRLDDLTPPEWREVAREINTNLLTTGRSPQREKELLRKDGSRVSILLGATMLDPARKDIAAFVLDITARKQAEREREEGLQRERTARLAAEESQRRLSLLAEAGELLSSSLDTDHTLDQLAHLVVPQVADWCAVTIVDSDTSTRQIVVAHADPEMAGWAGRFHDHLQQTASDLFGLSQVLATGTTRVYQDIPPERMEAAPLDPTSRQFVLEAGVSSVVIVPVVARGEIVGAMSFVRTGPETQYADADLTLIGDIAYRAALAIENARLYEGTQRHADHLDAIAEISNVFAEASHDAQKVVESLAREMVEHIGDWAVVRLPSEDGIWLNPVAIHHPDPEAAKFLDTMFREAPLRFTEGMTGRVAASGEALMIPGIGPERLQKIIKPEYRPWIEHQPMYSILIVPMRRKMQVIGTIALFRGRPGMPYTIEDRRFVQNIADRAALALENAQLFHEAQEAARLREEFLSIASHEMRTPLTTITGFAHLLNRYVTQDQVDSSHLSTIADSLLGEAIRLDQLVGDLLDVSRIQQGRLDIRPEPCNLTEILQSTVDRIRNGQSAGVGREIVVNAPANVYGVWDPTRIDQVVTNLLTNALKYSSEGAIRLSLDIELDDCAVLTVSDQGVGIPLEEQDRLFEPFARGQDAHQLASGTGLGLYITRQIIEHHGGTIDLDSQPGQGATFIIRLPMDGDEEACDPEPDEE